MEKKKKQLWGGFSFLKKKIKFSTEYFQDLTSRSPSLRYHQIAFFLSHQSTNYRVTVSRFGVSLPAPASPSPPRSPSSIETPRPAWRTASSHFPPLLGMVLQEAAALLRFQWVSLKRCSYLYFHSLQILLLRLLLLKTRVL